MKHKYRMLLVEETLKSIFANLNYLDLKRRAIISVFLWIFLLVLYDVVNYVYLPVFSMRKKMCATEAILIILIFQHPVHFNALLCFNFILKVA